VPEISRDLETWLPVVGYEDRYEVSDQGRVASKPYQASTRYGEPCWRPARILASRKTKKGYVIVTLNRSRGDSAQKRVHRLVLEAFVGPCPEGMECCHGPGGPSDNRLSNIRWDTRNENARDIVRHGNHWQANKTHCTSSHRLAHPNLIEVDGHRRCWACARADARVADALKRGLPPVDRQAIADRLYVQTMAAYEINELSA
jgi:hypothetical protein